MIQSPYEMMTQFVGTKELKGGQLNNPLILAMIATCDETAAINDEVAWCSAAINFFCKACNLPRSKSLAAKSNLKVGFPVTLDESLAGFDVVILNRTTNPALGHVGFFASYDRVKGLVFILAGNQDNAISVKAYPIHTIAGIRRIQ